MELDMVRVCTLCKSLKPITEFRLRSHETGYRFHQCNACHRETERKRVARKVAMKRRREFEKLLTKLKNAKYSNQVEAVCRLMLLQTGGLEKLVEMMAVSYQRATKKGGFPAYRWTMSLVRLFEYADDRLVTKPPEGMTDEELDEVVMDSVKQMIRRDPTLAIAAAAELGWEIRPAA